MSMKTYRFFLHHRHVLKKSFENKWFRLLAVIVKSSLIVIVIDKNKKKIRN